MCYDVLPCLYPPTVVVAMADFDIRLSHRPISGVQIIYLSNPELYF